MHPWRRSAVALLAVLAACSPSGGAESSTSTVGASTTTTAPSTTSTVVETTTTTVDPAVEFLESVADAPPAVTAVTVEGFRRYERVDGTWTGGPLVRFADGPFENIPMAASTPMGVVYGTPDGAIHLVDGDEDQVAVPAGGATLHDIVSDGDTAVAIVGPDGLSAIMLDTGESEPVYEARAPIESASYGGGMVLLLRGGGAEAVPTLVDDLGRPIRLDLLADGNPVSAVLSPDGSVMFFSTDATEESTVFSLALGSQGPAAAHALGVGGQVTALDTDGAWVSGLVGGQPFLLDTTTDEVHFGPIGVRLMFDRSGRAYTGPGAAPAPDVVEGRFFGWIRSATAGSIQFDEAEFLTGDEAAAAAEEAGEESPPPNDFYIRNTSEETRRIPLSQDVEIRVQASYPEAGVDWEAIAIDQWLRLLDGDASAVEFEWYGQGALPYWVTVEDGAGVLLEEVYLP